MRFTPAYAGKICRALTGLCAIRVHPRIRGEDFCAAVTGAILGGSPPHTRGRFFIRREVVGVVGFTPAYAGKISHKVVSSPHV